MHASATGTHVLFLISTGLTAVALLHMVPAGLTMVALAPALWYLKMHPMEWYCCFTSLQAGLWLRILNCLRSTGKSSVVVSRSILLCSSLDLNVLQALTLLPTVGLHKQVMGHLA